MNNSLKGVTKAPSNLRANTFPTLAPARPHRSFLLIKVNIPRCREVSPVRLVPLGLFSGPLPRSVQASCGGRSLMHSVLWPALAVSLPPALQLSAVLLRRECGGEQQYTREEGRSRQK